jgi:thioesterase domain-containing protein/acyl carrier protein
MVPAYFYILEEMPLLPNGKINKKELINFEIQKTGNENRIIVKPASNYEDVLYTIWKKILGIEIISTEDNFFELGGHSILAAQMFNEFENATGIKIPLAALFKFQTIKEIVQNIHSDLFKSGWTPLIEIKKNSKEKNIFLVHGAEGNILLYRELAEYLDSGYSVYGLQARGLNGAGYISETIEEMAADYIEAIKKVQPSGPYNVGGYCMGGTIAYEIAQQLTLNGDKVNNLFLIETYNACFNCASDKHEGESNALVENIKFHFDNIKKLSGSDKVKFIRQKSEVLKRRTFAKINSFSDAMGFNLKDDPGTSKLTFKVRDINDKAQMDYTPETYSGKTVLLRPRVSYSAEPDPDFGWKDLINGEFKVYNLDLAPRGMLIEPFVKETAAIISNELSV